MLVVLSVLFASLSVIHSCNIKDRHDDLIKYLPGAWPPSNIKQYSGYLCGVTDNIQLHYWFVEAAFKPETAPLVLWLNGGPGCSSLEGFFSENGPFQIVQGPTLTPNPYSWHLLANMLYLEAPAGVGFSYAVDGNVTTDDDLTSLNNYHALLNFLKKFPEFQGRDFYITGESYGGVYVPTLALRIIESKQFHLKGIAVGNGLTSYKLNDNSLAYFINYHGLVDQSSWTKLLETCCNDPKASRCMFTDNNSTECQTLMKSIVEDSTVGLNIYNLYSPCYGGAQQFQSPSVHYDFGNLLRTNRHIELRRRILLQARNTGQLQLKIPCVDDSVLQTYLDMSVVRSSINMKSDQPTAWEVCSDQVNREYIRTYSDLKSQYREILDSGVRILIYNGDTDMACNFLGDDWFVDDLGMKQIREQNHWLYDDPDGTQQIGGFWKKFDMNGTSLTYSTVRGAGHMVPQDKPIPMFHLISTFLENGDL